MVNISVCLSATIEVLSSVFEWSLGETAGADLEWWEWLEVRWR